MNRSNRAYTLLLELAVAIAVFALAAALCCRVLISARNISLEARELNRAVQAVSSAAELLEALPRQEALERLAGEDRLRLQLRQDRELVYCRIDYLLEDRVLYSVELALEEEAAP